MRKIAAGLGLVGVLTGCIGADEDLGRSSPAEAAINAAEFIQSLPKVPMDPADRAAEIGPHFLGGEQDLIGVTGLSFAPTGQVVLVSERDPFLRWFSPQGVLQAYVDEASVSTLSTRTPRFPRPWFWQRRGRSDEPVVWVPALERIAVLTAGGQVRWSPPFDAGIMSGDVVAAVDPETVLVREVRWKQGQPGLLQEEVVLRLYRVGRTQPIELGTWPGRRWTETPRGREPVPFTLAPAVTAGTGRVVVAEPAGRLVLFGADGRSLGNLATGISAAVVTEQDRATFLRVGLEALGEASRTHLEGLLAAIPEDTLRPAFDQLLQSPSGYLWVRHARVDLETPPRWLVFDSSGVPVADVEVPGGFSLRAVHDEWLAGGAYHPLMFEIVHLYPSPLDLN